MSWVFPNAWLIGDASQSIMMEALWYYGFLHVVSRELAVLTLFKSLIASSPLNLHLLSLCLSQLRLNLTNINRFPAGGVQMNKIH